MNDTQSKKLEKLMDRIARALEAQSGTGTALTPEDWNVSSAWVWQAHRMALKPVTDTGALSVSLLVGLDQHARQLLDNTKQFADGYPANNALLWGARGMGKSSLVKAIHAEINASCLSASSPRLSRPSSCLSRESGNLSEKQEDPRRREESNQLMLIEIYREDVGTLPALLDLLRGEEDKRFILFCDDLSFDEQDSSYKSLKAVLEGGIESRPANVLFYATSNRRHLIPRQMIENERSTAIHPGESVEEKVSLSDRFGLWLGFYPCSQADYLAMIHGYANEYDLKIDDAKALEWAKTRGNRSGRVAWQFIQHIAGIQKKPLT